MIQLNNRDPRPIYEQIKESLCRLILTGVLTEGERLPSVRELAGKLAINPNTIQRAYREMESEGFIYSVTGKGSYVVGRYPSPLFASFPLRTAVPFVIANIPWVSGKSVLISNGFCSVPPWTVITP